MNMKNIKLLFTLVFCMISISHLSQNTYTLPTGNKTIFLDEINRVSIIGTTENAATIEVDGRRHSRSDRAKGLKLINGLGLDDNTDIGLHVKEDGDQIVIREVSSRSHRRYTFYIPSDYVVTYHSTSHSGGKLTIEDVTAELDVSTLHNSIEMSGVKGPMAIHSVHGRIEAIFDQVNQSGPISIYSVHGHVDVSIPTSTKADLMISSGHGEIYSDVDMKIDTNQSGLKKISNSDIRAKVNGGGVKFSLKTQHADIYLRNK